MCICMCAINITELRLNTYWVHLITNWTQLKNYELYNQIIKNYLKCREKYNKGLELVKLPKGHQIIVWG